MSTALNNAELATYIDQAVELSLQHVNKGGIPFSALVIGPDGTVLGTGVNRVVVERDPLAHAEIVAMRDAGSKSNHFGLAGCVLIASGEPCALCYYAALHFNVSDIVFAVDRHQAAKYGFDYVDSYRMFAVPPEQWPGMNVRSWPVENGLEPFTRWRQRRSNSH